MLCLVWLLKFYLFCVVTGAQLYLIWLLEPLVARYGYQDHALFVVVIGTMFCLVWLLEPCFVWCGYWNHVLFVVFIGIMFCLVWLPEPCFPQYFPGIMFSFMAFIERTFSLQAVCREARLSQQRRPYFCFLKVYLQTVPSMQSVMVLDTSVCLGK